MSIRHNCEHGGCYIKKQTPDWGFLDSAFSGKIRVTDIDGAVEANGCLLILEWKGVGVPLLDGQRIMVEKITKKNQITVFVINGDAEESIPKHITIFANGVISRTEECGSEKLKKYCQWWETKARE